jgi:hypothetical protein
MSANVCMPTCPLCGKFLADLRTQQLQQVWAAWEGVKWDFRDLQRGRTAYWRYCFECHTMQMWPGDGRRGNRHSSPTPTRWWRVQRGSVARLVCGDLYLTEAPPEIEHKDYPGRGRRRARPRSPSPLVEPSEARSPNALTFSASNAPLSVTWKDGGEWAKDSSIDRRRNLDAAWAAGLVQRTVGAPVCDRSPIAYLSEDHCEVDGCTGAVDLAIRPVRAADGVQHGVFMCGPCYGRLLAHGSVWLPGLECTVEAVWGKERLSLQAANDMWRLWLPVRPPNSRQRRLSQSTGLVEPGREAASSVP